MGKTTRDYRTNPNKQLTLHGAKDDVVKRDKTD